MGWGGKCGWGESVMWSGEKVDGWGEMMMEGRKVSERMGRERREGNEEEKKRREKKRWEAGKKREK